MKKIYTFIMLCSAAFAVSCSKDTASEVKTETFTIQMTAPQTKIHMVSGKTVWTSGDNISVFSGNGTGHTFVVESSGDTSTNLTCSDWVSGNIPQWGVFCYKENQWQTYPVEQISDGKFKAYLSSYQRVTSDNSFSSKSNLAVAKIDYDSESGCYTGQMKNAVGLVKITVPVEDIVKISLEDANGTADIAGELELDYNNGDPICSVIDGKGLKSIYVDRRKGSENISFTKGSSVYFCVLPNVSFKPKFTFEKTDGTTCSVTGNMEISVNRSNFVDLGTPTLEFIPEGYVKDVATLDFTSWPFVEGILGSTAQKQDENRVKTYTYSANSNYTFDIARGETILSNKTSVGTYYKSNGELRFADSNDGKEYIQVNCTDDIEIASISITTSNSGKVPMRFESIDASEKIYEGDVPANTPYNIDLRASRAAKFGCRICLTKSGQQYNIKKLEVTYYVKVQPKQ